jgi:hypothetical protein
MPPWHLEPITQFHFGLDGWYLHHYMHWCSHLLLKSAEFVNLVLRVLCLSTPFAPVFGCSWPVSCYILDRVCPSGLLSLRSPFAYSYVPHWYSVFHLRWSILATWPPHFNLRLCATATMPFMLVLCLTSAFVTRSLHTTFSILHSIIRWQVWSIFFSFNVSDHVRAPYNRTGNTQDSRTSFYISSFFLISRPV